MAMAATGATIARCGGPGGRRPQRVDPSASTRFRKEGEDHGEHAVVELARSTEEEKQRQLERLADFQARHSGERSAALDRLRDAALAGENLFAVLMDAVRCCSLGEISEALFEVGGRYRRNV